MAFFRADFTADTIYDISIEGLARRGVKLLLADLDNTLVPYQEALPNQTLMNWRDELYAYGITLFILSNNRREHRPREFAVALEVPFIGHAAKPWKKSFYKAMEEMHVTPEQTAIVGDQIFTDVLGGNRAGVTTILVKPIRLAGNPGRYLRYAVEIPFRLLSRKGDTL